MHFPVFPFQAGAFAHLRPNHFIQCQITDLIRSDEVHKSQLCELVSARAAVNNGVITPAIAPPPPTLQRTTWSRPSVPFGGGGGSLGAHGPQIQQLKSRRAARKRGKKSHRKRTRFCSSAKLLLEATDETCSSGTDLHALRLVALVGGRKLALGSGEGSRRRNALEEVVNLALDQIRIRIRVEERSYVGSCSH